MRILLTFILFPACLLGANWYIRPDGGTATQCTGTTDAAYPGSGSNQACGFNNPYYLWTNDPPQSQPYETPKWKISGGDTVIVKNGDYRMGYKNPSTSGWWNYLGCRGNNHGCFNPPIPPGTATAPTRIVGESWQSGCGTKPVLRGAGGVSTVLNLKGTSHVDVECIDFTDAAQCRLATLTGESLGCVNYQSDDAYVALQTDQTTSYVTLRNLFIHGFASAGILGSIGGHITADNLHLRGNGNFGWDFDPGNGTSSTGPLSITNTTIEWSACIERYPLADPVIVACYDQAGANANGDALGFVDLVGDITLDHDIIRYNQQDGLDALYVKSGTTLSVTNSQFYGNNGQEIKTGGATNTIIRNNLVVGNCDRQRAAVSGVTAPNFNQYEKSFCRAQDMVAMAYRKGTSTHFENNTLVTYNPTGFNMQCRNAEDVFNGSGREGWDGSVNSSLATNGSRRDFPTVSAITNIAMTGAIYVYPASGSSIAKRVGREGVDTSCSGSPCQFWYKPGTTTLYQDPADTPLKSTDELKVDYATAAYCTTSTLSFKNNLVRGYTRLATGSTPGSFYYYNLTPDASQFLNNIYCGLRPFTAHPSETEMQICPGTFFTEEPSALVAESDLDHLDLYPGPYSAVLDHGVTVAGLTTDFNGSSRPYGPAYDVGAYEVVPGGGATPGTLSTTSTATSSSSGSSTGTSGTTTPKLALGSSSVNFGNQTVGTASTARSVTLSNSGTATLTLSGITLTGTNASDFSVANNCGTNLAVGASCTITVGFKPSAVGTRTAAVSIANSTGSAGTVALTGTGVTSSPAQIKLSTTQVTFGQVALGSSMSQSIAVSNPGGASLQISGITITGTSASDFRQSNTCGTALAAGASCSISVTFAPTALYSRSAVLSIADNATGSPQKVTLAGSGVGVPTAVVSTKALTFAAQKVGTISPWQTFTVKNTGTGNLYMTSYTITGTNAADFLQNRHCYSGLAPGVSCTISLEFKPLGAGTRTAVYTIVDNAAGSPHKVTLTGTGQ